MGEMYEYFEDFPEENPANWVNGEFNPRAAKRLLAQKRQLEQDQQNLDNEIAEMRRKVRLKCEQRQQEQE